MRPCTLTTLVHARWLVDGTGEGPRQGAGVLIDGERIAEVGPVPELTPRAGRRLDLGDATLVPGFVDGHTHLTIRPGDGDQHGQLRRPHVWQALRAVRNLQAIVRSGVTTARIMGERGGIDAVIKSAVAEGELVGPRLF